MLPEGGLAEMLPDSIRSFFHRRFRTINTLAVPFLPDDGVADDDYALLPPPKPLKLLQLTGVAFFAVSGSAYGIEETVSSGGPLLALVSLSLAAALWSAPMAMVACELSVALPHSGGYIVWVNAAFGPLASLLNGVANLLCNVFDCALYPLLLTDYLQRALLPLLPPEPHGGSGSWTRLAPDVLGPLLRLLLVGLAAVANVLGANVVGQAAGALMVLASAPFLWLTIAAYASPSSEPLAPLNPSLQNTPSSYAQLSFFLHLVLWNTCGYDSSGMVAAEVVDARRTYPRAMTLALGLTTALYILPLAACASADRNWRSWGEGQFESLGLEFGGYALGAALLFSSIVSMVGVMCTLLMTSSRAIAAMAQLRMLPPALARLHPTSGAPHLAVSLNAALIAVATVFLRFDALLQLSMLFYAINAIMQCAAVLRLRSTHPHRLRPKRTLPSRLLALPVGIAAIAILSAPAATWFAAIALLVATLVAYLLIHASRLAAGVRPGGPASARAVAAAMSMRVAEPGDEYAAHGEGEEGDDLGEADAYAHSCARSGGGVGGGYAHAMRESVEAGGGAGDVPRGDAWFGQLLAGVGYRSVPQRKDGAREAAARAAMSVFEVPQASEMLADGEVEMSSLLQGMTPPWRDRDGDHTPPTGSPSASEAALQPRDDASVSVTVQEVGSASGSCDVTSPPSVPAPQPGSAQGSAPGSVAGSMLLREGEEYVTEVSLDDETDDILE